MPDRRDEPLAGLGPGVLPYQALLAARDAGWIRSAGEPVPDANIQPASVDLRVGETAFALRCSFLPDDGVAVREKLRDFTIEEFSLDEGRVLEINRPYLVPLVEELALPEGVRGRTNPKSSTGRLDVFTRVVTDGNYRFDEIEDGYRGGLYLEIVPRSFPIRLRPHERLNQLRLSTGATRCSDEEIREIHRESPLLFSDAGPVAEGGLRVAGGLFLRVGLRADDEDDPSCYQARRHCPPIDLSLIGHYEEHQYWTPIRPAGGGERLILDPEEFYLLISTERVSIPPWLAAEMTAYDPTAGELRTHYAGFFDPGFGYSRDGERAGTAAVLEVRAHDVPFLIEHGQRICKLSFERMAAEPAVTYGRDAGSTYQDQDLTLSKHFRRSGSRAQVQLRLGSG